MLFLRPHALLSVNMKVLMSFAGELLFFFTDDAVADLGGGGGGEGG